MLQASLGQIEEALRGEPQASDAQQQVDAVNEQLRELRKVPRVFFREPKRGFVSFTQLSQLAEVDESGMLVRNRSASRSAAWAMQSIAFTSVARLEIKNNLSWLFVGVHNGNPTGDGFSNRGCYGWAGGASREVYPDLQLSFCFL